MVMRWRPRVGGIVGVVGWASRRPRGHGAIGRGSPYRPSGAFPSPPWRLAHPDDCSAAHDSFVPKRSLPQCIGRAEVTSLAARYRLPAVYPFRLFTEVGGLLSYGNDLRDNYRRAASYADRIL